MSDVGLSDRSSGGGLREFLRRLPQRLARLAIDTPALRRPLVGSTLAMVDLVSGFLGTVLLSISWVAVFGADAARGVAPSFLPVLIVTLLVLGLYSGQGPSPFERFRLRAVGIIAYLAVALLLGGGDGLRLQTFPVLLLQWLSLLLFGYYAELFVRAFFVRHELWGAPTALVGCDAKVVELYHSLRKQPEIGIRPIGFVKRPADQRVSAESLPAPVLGRIEDIAALGSTVDVLVFGGRADIVAATAEPPPPGAPRMVLHEDAESLQTLWLHTRALGNAIGIEIRRDLYRPINLGFKRAIDLLITVPLALVAVPVIGLLCLIVKLADPGPAFYVQTRIGRNGRLVPVFKIRTMYQDAERRLEETLRNNPAANAEWQRYFKLTNDPRILPLVGNFIRRTSLDELPQLFNVLRGEMSLVGPRPFPEYHLTKFDGEFQGIRSSVPPGLTGLWQVSARSDGDLDVQKLQDLYYIRNWSFWLDLYILFQTLPAVLSAKGAK